MQSFDRGKQVDIAILDFSKAFDIVPHDRLLHKLSTNMESEHRYTHG